MWSLPLSLGKLLTTSTKGAWRNEAMWLLRLLHKWPWRFCLACWEHSSRSSELPCKNSVYSRLPCCMEAQATWRGLKGRQEVQRRQWDNGSRGTEGDVMIEAEGGVVRATSQGMLGASRNWKRQGNRLSLEPPERMQPGGPCDLQDWIALPYCFKALRLW